MSAQKPRDLGRREAMRRMAIGSLGATALSAWAEALVARAEAQSHLHAVAAPAADWTPKFLNAHQDRSVTALSELIIPETDTPGAKSALVNRFIDSVLASGRDPERREFVRGLRAIDGRSNELFGADFVDATTEQQTALLTILSSDKNRAFADEIGREFFRAIKGLTAAGYYGSEVGVMKELGDNGQMFFMQFKGCTHPEHGGPAPAATASAKRGRKG